MRHRLGSLFLAIAFATIIIGPGLVQVAVEWQRGEWPQSLAGMNGWPTPDRLQDYQQRLEDQSVIIASLRPWVQYAQFVWLRDPGSKTLLGVDGWYFYRPGVQYVTERPRAASDASDAVAAICDFRDQLAAQGIHLIVVPVPDKESVYPDKLTRRARDAYGVCGTETASLLGRLRVAKIEVVDLFGMYAMARVDEEVDAQEHLYLRQDSHWSPSGVSLAAVVVARHILQQSRLTRGSTVYATKELKVERLGDMLQMMRVPQIEQQIKPEEVICQQVVHGENGRPYADDPHSEVLVLGDSFLRIYQQDEPGSAGFIAHLAKELRQPIASLVNDGGASTLVRQQLSRRPALLSNKRVVVWEFVERDIRWGMEGWQRVPLPKMMDEVAAAGRYSSGGNRVAGLGRREVGEIPWVQIRNPDIDIRNKFE